MLTHILKNLLLVTSFILSQSSMAQTSYPSEPIKLVVPYVAGASTDNLARMVGKSVSEQLKQTVVVENRPGAGGIIASEYVHKQKPDGYTFMLTTDGILSVNTSIYKSIPYEPLKDFDPLSIAVSVPLVLAVQTASPFKTLKEVIDYAKKNPNKLTYGSSGIGSSQHTAGELFNDLAGIVTTHVPYKGGGPAMNDLLGGHISMMFVQTASAEKLAKAGRIRILGIGSPKRSPILPAIATFDEQGLNGYDSDTWYGFNMPAGVDAKVTAILHRAIVNALKENTSQLESLGYTVVAGDPQHMTDTVTKNTEKWKKLAKQIGIYRQQ